jgi:hypothetical protein
MSLAEDAPHSDITYQIIGAALEVFHKIGPGRKEAVYQKMLTGETTARRLTVTTHALTCRRSSGTIRLWFPSPGRRDNRLPKEVPQMLKAHWSGYEIDSSEAAYSVKVPKPAELGTLVTALLRSDYFVRSFYLLFEAPMERLQQFISERSDPQDKLAAKALQQLDKQIAKFDPDGERVSRIGVRAIEPILNYVGTHRQELLDAQVFCFGLTAEQEEYWADVGVDFEFEPGQRVNEVDFYSEQEIPFDGVVLYLGCSLIGLDKLPPEEQSKAKAAVRRTDVMIQDAEDEPRRGGRGMNGIDTIFQSMFGPRDPWQTYNRPQMLTLRVRLNPDATFVIIGRWMDDGQFAYGYYDYVLHQAAKKAKARVSLHMVG